MPSSLPVTGQSTNKPTCSQSSLTLVNSSLGIGWTRRNVLRKIRDEIEHSITGFDNNCVIDVCEVLQAVRQLKPGKSDGYVGLPLTTFCMFIIACSYVCA